MVYNGQIGKAPAIVEYGTKGEEVMELEQTSTIPDVGKTIVLLRQLNADEKVQQEAWRREKQLHDEASALGFARRKERRESMARLVKKGRLTEARGAEEAGASLPEFREFMETYSQNI